MSNTRYPAFIFLFVVLISLSIPLFYYLHLPEIIVSRYHINDTVDGWISRKSFLVVQMLTIVFLSGTLFALSYFIPKFPNSIINLPNKDFWLSAERRGKTIGVLQRFSFWLGSLTLSCISLIMQEVYLANLSDNNRISNVWIYLIVFLVIITLIVIKLVMHFNRTENTK